MKFLINITDPDKVDKYICLGKRSLDKVKRNSKLLFFIPGIISIILMTLVVVFAIVGNVSNELILTLMTVTATAIGVFGTTTLENFLKKRINKIINIKRAIILFIAEFEKEEYMYPALSEQYQDGYVNDELLEAL